MSAKKKSQQTALPEKLKPLWQKYSLYICGGLLILLLLFSFLLWYKTVHAPAAVSDVIRQNVEKFATGDGTAVFEVLTVTDRNATLKMESPELDLEDVVSSRNRSFPTSGYLSSFRSTSPGYARERCHEKPPSRVSHGHNSLQTTKS